MPDISMCLDHACPSSGRCHRYLAVPSHYQWFGDHERSGRDKCDSYQPAWPSDRSLELVDQLRKHQDELHDKGGSR